MEGNPISFSLSHLFHQGLKVTGQSLDPFGTVTGNSLFGGGGNNGQKGEVAALSAQARNAAAQGQAEGQVQLNRSIGETRVGYGQARDAAGVGRTNAIQAANDAGVVQQGRATQGLVNSGLYNTTIAQNASQGISAGVSRAVGDIDAHYAQILGELGIGEANAVSGIRRNIASNAQSGGNFQAGLYDAQANRVASEVHEDPNAWLQSLFQIGGTALGYGIGGPAGGAVGGGFGGQGIY